MSDLFNKIRLDLLWHSPKDPNNLNESIINNKHFPIGSFIRTFFISSGFRAVFLVRLALSLYKKSKVLSYPIFKYLDLFYHLSVSKTTIIEGGLRLPHPNNIIISAKRIGKMVTIGQNVTIGGNFGKIKDGNKWPEIGGFTIVAAGSVIGGPIKIGVDVIIGANSVIVKDIESHAIAAGNPGKIIKSKIKDGGAEENKNFQPFWGISPETLKKINSFG